MRGKKRKNEADPKRPEPEVGMEIIQEALKKGQKTLSEYDSKRVLSAYGFPVVREKLVNSRAGAVKAAVVTVFRLITGVISLTSLVSKSTLNSRPPWEDSSIGVPVPSKKAAC